MDSHDVLRDHVTERLPEREGGFALLVALLAIVGLTALATGGFLLSDSERAMAAAFDTSVDAFYVAEAGLHRFVARTSGPPAQTAVYDIAGGTATVTTQRMAETGSGGRSVYRVVSEGEVDLGRGRTSSRQVSVLVVLDPLFTSLPGALVSGTGIDKNGSSGTISGNDAATSSDCPDGGTDGPGLVVPPDNTPDDEGNGYGGVDEAVTEGNPEVEEVTDPLSQLDIDWQAIVDGTAFNFTHTVSSSSPDASWPDYGSLSEDDYPVVYGGDGRDFTVDGNDDGRGLLVVRGDLDMNGSFEWNGTILVGGHIISDGNQTITGGLVTGLNATLDPPEDPGEGSIDLGNGNKLFQFHTCEIQKAARSAGSLVQLDHTWSEIF